MGSDGATGLDMSKYNSARDRSMMINNNNSSDLTKLSAGGGVNLY